MRPVFAWLACLVLVVASGCQSKETTFLNCDPYKAEDVGGGEPDTVTQADVPVNEDATVAPAPRLVGDPCTDDGDCPSEEGWEGGCLSGADLPSALALPEPMCTLVFCSGDNACWGEAACMDAGGFGLCMPECEDYAGCRYAQGEGCFVGMGERTGCMPAAAQADAACGDGVCDETERWVEGACELDCGPVPSGPRPAGAPCAGGGDCIPGGMCLDTATIGLVIQGDGVEIPGNMCTSNIMSIMTGTPSCSKEEELEQCGEGGVCLDGSAIAEMPEGSVMLCLRACDSDSDCRYTEGYRCYRSGDEGGCLPDTVIAAIRCGDGVCDPAEELEPTRCEEDCQ